MQFSRYIRLLLVIAAVSNIQTIVGTTSSPLALTYSCSPSGEISNIKGPNGTANALTVIYGNGSFCHLSYESCLQSLKTKSKIHVMYANGNIHTDLIEGKAPQYFELQCKAGSYVQSATASPFDIDTITPSYIPKTQTVPHTQSLTLDILKNGINLTAPVNVGESLTLRLNGPAGNTVSPIECTAFAGSTSATKYTLWKNCTSADSAILEPVKWTYNSNESNVVCINMYAFRFMESSSILIQCSANICPGNKTTCNGNHIAKWCNTETGAPETSPRTRRDVRLLRGPLITTQNDSAMTFFTVKTDVEPNGGIGVSPNRIIQIVFLMVTSILVNNMQ